MDVTELNQPAVWGDDETLGACLPRIVLVTLLVAGLIAGLVARAR